MVRSRQHNLDIALKAYLLVVATVSALFSELFFLSSFFRALSLSLFLQALLPSQSDRFKSAGRPVGRTLFVTLVCSSA